MATIYITGTTTLASIASDSSGTPKSNPFTADSDGYISFYALDGVYDVKMSGGGLLTPITRSGFWIVTSSGGGGGGITGSGTTGRFPIFTSSSAIGNSVFQQVGTSEFAPAATGKRINLGTESQQVVEIANAAVGGTVQNRLAILTGAPSTAITAAITDTSKIVGIVIANAGTSGNAQIVQNGSVDCEFDGATTAGNYVGASTTLAGRCKDLGSSLPTTGVQVIGRVLETIGSAGNALVYTFTGEQHTSGLGGSGTTNYMSYWTSASTLAASNLLYDISGQILQSGYSFDIQNGGLSELTLETDQVIIKGGVNRATSAHVVQVKGVASQSGDYFRAIDSTSSTKFRIRSTGQPSFGGVNYTFPSLPATTSCLQISSAGVISTVACTTGGVRQAINVMQAPYSCVGDGVTDDTACFQAALDAGEASDGKLVYAPTATYKVTGLTVAGGTMLEGDGREKTIIYGYTDVPVLDLTPGTGVFLYRGPTVRSLTVKGSNSGSNQIGIKVDSTPYMEEAEVSDVIVRDTGSHGVYFGNVFSSTFKRIYASATTSGYPFLFNQFNMPGNTYEGLYAQDVNSGSPAGFRIRTGDIHCWGCNGINNSSSNSWWATVGDKIGVDGATSNISAYFNCWGCNIESSKAGGIQHYSDSTSNLDGRTIFAGDSSGSGTYIALKYEVTTPGSGGLPAAQPKGNLGPLVVFANSPLAYYANSEVIHANDLPPVTIEGDVRQADGAIISSYRNTTNSRSEKVFRLDARMPVTTITASASYTQPGATNYEANCAAPCTLTLPWPGYWASMEQFIYIRNIGAGALTLAANSGGSFNGGAGPVLAQYESVTYIAHSASADYRQVGFAGAGVSNRIPYFSDVQRLASSSNFTYDGTTVLNQKAGGNPYFAANDTTNSITTRFGPLAGAPDRAIIGTTSNHPFGLYANNGERWTIGTTGHLTPGAATSYNIGSASLPINDLTIGGKLYWTGSTVFDFSGSGSPEGVVTAGIGSLYRRTNGSTGTTFYVKESGTGNTGWSALGGAGAGGITTLNSLTAATQSFAVGTSGTDFAVSSATSTHTFNLPDAGASARGVITTGTQTIAGAKTVTSVFTANPGTTPTTGILVDINSLGSAGTRDSNWLVFRGRSNDGTTHLTEWKLFNDVTSNAGASNFSLQTRIDAASFTEVFTVSDTGLVSGGDFQGNTFTAGVGFVGDGSGLASLDASQLTAGTVAANRGGAGTISGILKANGSGTVSAVTVGTGLAFDGTTLSATVTGTVGGTGTTNTIAKFSATSTIADSIITESSGPATIAIAGRESITGLTINTDATNTVGSLTAAATFTKNDTNTRAFDVVRIKPTLNFGGSNTGTTVNYLVVDSTNTAVTGATVNLATFSYGGNLKFGVDSSGAVTFATGVRQVFTPSTTVASLNFGQVASDPSSGVNGDCVYQTGSNKFRCYENGAWANMIGATPSLTSTQVPFGDGSNLLTSSSAFTYNTSTKLLSIVNGSGAASLTLNGSSDTSKVNFGAGSVPGNQGGIVFPFVGGGITTGPGIWWCSSASYASCSGLFISNGLTYQGTNSTHDHFKIAVGTGTSSSGANVWDFAPTSSLLTQTMSTSATGTAHVGNAITLTSTGTAAANFGYSQTFTLENGSGSNVAATAIAHTWSVATAGAETGRVAISTNLAGTGVGEAFVVEGSQYYGTLYSKGNISGAVTIDFANGNVVTATLTGNVTSLAFSNIKTGGIYYLHFIQDALGPWTLTVPAALKVNGGYVISAGVNKRDLLICSATSTSQLYCSKAQDQQ